MGGNSSEEDFGGVIYIRRKVAVSRRRSSVRSWVVYDSDSDSDSDELIKKNDDHRASVFSIDPDVLDCPICLHPLLTPVVQCDNGHVACSSCCSKLKSKCPFCCTPIGVNDNRCVGLEKFIQSITSISCKYGKYGCKYTMRYADKSKHEQTCGHATCNCPHPSCSYVNSYNNLYLHFHIQHEPSTTRFTFNTPFSLTLVNHKHRIFLQEQHTNLIFIFILNHHQQAFSIDFLGPPASNSCFVYHLTASAKAIKTSLSLQSQPGIYTQYDHTQTNNNNNKTYLTVPYAFQHLSVCIRRKTSISSGVEPAAAADEQVEDNGGNANGALQVVLTDPAVLDCSICHHPLCTPIFQCQNGHLACCLCCSKVESVCPICYPLGYKYNRCRGLEAAIESILCINDSNKLSEMCPSQEDELIPPIQDDELMIPPIQDVESEEEEDEDENQEQHIMTCSVPNTSNKEVVLHDHNVLECWICSNLLSPPVFQCGKGHLACSSCYSELKGVCYCCMPINNRCQAFEKFIESVSSISCKNASYGCKKTVPYNKKSKHEQSCPHAKCWCPYPSCSFAGSFKSLYLHFDIKHAVSTARFTYDTSFSICIEIDQTTIFLQEQNENVIFILNQEVVQQHVRAFNIDCVGVGCFKSGFVYQLTAKSMETCLSLRSVPEIYTRWSSDTPRKCNLAVPSAGFAGLLSLSICIKKKKLIPPEFEEEMKEVSSVYLDERPKVTLTNLDIFYCSTCLQPLCNPVNEALCSPVNQCEKGHLSCSSCCSKMKKICPLCYTSIDWDGYSHSIGLEDIIETTLIPCKNAKHGCLLRMRLCDISRHEQLCCLGQENQASRKQKWSNSMLAKHLARRL